RCLDTKTKQSLWEIVSENYHVFMLKVLHFFILLSRSQTPYSAMKVIICCISFLLLSICPSLLAMEGTGVALKVSLSGKIYKRFSFVLEEDIRPRDDFREAGLFLTTGEINYRILPNLRAGAGYMSLVRYKASEEVRNRYYLY